MNYQAAQLNYILHGSFSQIKTRLQDSIQWQLMKLEWSTCISVRACSMEGYESFPAKHWINCSSPFFCSIFLLSEEHTVNVHIDSPWKRGGARDKKSWKFLETGGVLLPVPFILQPTNSKVNNWILNKCIHCYWLKDEWYYLFFFICWMLKALFFLKDPHFVTIALIHNGASWFGGSQMFKTVLITVDLPVSTLD